VLKGEVAIGSKRVSFSVNIPNYQRLLRVKVEIKEEEHNLRVIVTDADYDIKKCYFEKAYQH
jgi:hypothetical protein